MVRWARAKASHQLLDQRDERQQVLFDGQVEGVVVFDVHGHCRTKLDSGLELPVSTSLVSLVTVHDQARLLDREQLPSFHFAEAAEVAAQQNRVALQSVISMFALQVDRRDAAAAHRILHLPRPRVVELVVRVLRGHAGQLLDRADFVRNAGFGRLHDGGDLQVSSSAAWRASRCASLGEYDTHAEQTAWSASVRGWIACCDLRRSECDAYR